jgi:hypothetical protein
MSLDRRTVRVFRSHDEADDGGFMPGSPAERLAQVWELTHDAWLFFDPHFDAALKTTKRCCSACPTRALSSSSRARRASGRTQDLADIERLTGRTGSRDDDLTR